MGVKGPYLATFVYQLSRNTGSLKKGKNQSLLQAWTDREGSRRPRLSDFKTIGT